VPMLAPSSGGGYVSGVGIELAVQEPDGLCSGFLWSKGVNLGMVSLAFGNEPKEEELMVVVTAGCYRSRWSDDMFVWLIGGSALVLDRRISACAALVLVLGASWMLVCCCR
jgi:hypothetical protein